MSRKKPKVVHTVTHHDTGISVEIKMIPDTLSFVAELPDGTRLQNVDGNKLQNDVWSWLEYNLRLVWQDVIAVEKLAPFHNTDNSFIGFNLKRFHIAEKAIISSAAHYRHVVADWGCRPGDPTIHSDKETYGWERVSQFSFNGEFTLPTFVANNAIDNRGTYYMAYSDELWAGLLKMQDAIAELKARLHAMLSDPVGIAQLASIGNSAIKVLSAGDK